MFDQYLYKLYMKKNLDRQEAQNAMDMIMQGKVSQISMSSFLTALKLKGETIDEITGFAKSMRKNAESLQLPDKGDYMDTCGTGGDGQKTINISTAAALVASCAGAKIVKHGNRSVSSKSGSADVLEAMGIKIDLDRDKAQEMIYKTGFAFLFAPQYHKSMKHAMPVRKELKTRTVFNILGPLSNPAKVNIQMMGVFDKKLVLPIANVLKELKLNRALVFHGTDGSDEFTCKADTFVAELNNGIIKTYNFKPLKHNNGSIQGGDGRENAKVLIDIFSNKIKDARREVVLLNSAAAIYLYGIVKSIEEGYEISKQIIKDKEVLKKIEILRKVK